MGNKLRFRKRKVVRIGKKTYRVTVRQYNKIMRIKQNQKHQFSKKIKEIIDNA